MTRICDLYEYNKLTKSINRYIDNTVEDAFGKLDLDIITFNKRVYNQYKYAIIFIYKVIRARWVYTFAYKGNAKNAVKKINKLI